MVKQKNVQIKSIPIRLWPKNERPRESLLEKGPEQVSDAGLLAILLGTGTANKDAVSLSREILIKFGGFRGLFSASSDELMKIKGLGSSKVSRLISVSEIAKRHLKEKITGKKYASNDREVADFLFASLRDRRIESFHAIYLDKALGILDVGLIHSGTVDSTVVYPAEVVKQALALNAAAVIFVHNHPGRTEHPGSEDRHLTKKLSTACRALGIKPLDHIIITGDSYISMKKLKMMR